MRTRSSKPTQRRAPRPNQVDRKGVLPKTGPMVVQKVALRRPAQPRCKLARSLEENAFMMHLKYELLVPTQGTKKNHVKRAPLFLHMTLNGAMSLVENVPRARRHVWSSLQANLHLYLATLRCP